MTKNKSNQENSRRKFLGNSMMAIAGLGALSLPNAVYGQFPVRNKKFRVISYNVLKCTGHPEERVENKEVIPSLMAKELAKYSPDVINFSESPDEPVVKRIADELNMDYAFFPSGGYWPGAIISSHKIVDSTNVPLVSGSRPEDLFTRHWGKATLELPNGELLEIHSVHLYPNSNPVSAAIRTREISEILRSMEAKIGLKESMIVMGDLNLVPESPEHAQWMEAGFVDTYLKVGKGDGLTIPVDVPKRRIDYVLAHGPMADQIVESRALFEGGFRFDQSDSESYALSDHLPQFAEFKLK